MPMDPGSWLATIIALPLVGLALWCAILWQRLAQFGISPLLCGTILALAVHFGLAELRASTMFDARSQIGLLAMAVGDNVVLDRTISDFVADLPFVLGWLMLGAGPILAFVIQRGAVVKHMALGLVAAASVLVIVNPGLALIERPIDTLAIGLTFLIGASLALFVRRRIRRDVPAREPA